MTIQLTTPYSTPATHGCPSVTAQEVKIAEVVLAVTEKTLTVRVQYGDTVNGAWIPACLPEGSFRVVNTAPDGTDFDDLMAAALASAAGVSLYEEVATTLYAWLIAQGFYAGTVQ